MVQDKHRNSTPFHSTGQLIAITKPGLSWMVHAIPGPPLRLHLQQRPNSTITKNFLGRYSTGTPTPTPSSATPPSAAAPVSGTVQKTPTPGGQSQAAAPSEATTTTPASAPPGKCGSTDNPCGNVGAAPVPAPPPPPPPSTSSSCGAGIDCGSG